MSEARKGMLLVISGPSGAGKGTLIKRLMEDDKSLVFSVSATTRAPREGEINGVHYHFVTMERFEELIAQDAFIEHALVHGNRYGTLRSEVDERLARGENVVLDIDVQGALRVMEKGIECVSIFIQPPSREILRERLVGRGTETMDVIERRMNNAVWELTQADQYKYNVVNDEIEKAVKRLQVIIEDEKKATAEK